MDSDARYRRGHRRGTAGELVMAYVTEQFAELRTADAGVRRDADGALHDMRVASRRLGSALKIFRPVLDGKRTDALRGELRWIGHSLGGARDSEVLHARLREALSEDGRDTARDAAAERVNTQFGVRSERAKRVLRGDLDSQRYFMLLDALDELVHSPPLTEAAASRADRILPQRVGKAYRQMRRLHDRAGAAGTGEEREALLHEVRKAAKRARYASEALVPAVGKDAKRFAAAMEGVQEVIGEYRDSVIAGETLIGLAVQAQEAGEDTFEIGRLAGLEEARSAAAAAAYDTAWRAASKKKLRRWMRG
ncbi:CHAD domain-containing protein [Cryobacterium sp. BB736]|uniref:CHAD domain-containing protein n=1 Tax=Cryobacterium sp. BB736 TaxID=2746963 RepID=UPI001874AB66|nr:CHAD domain-containing protein [Cryobacterium sp. BB736]